MGKIYKHWRDYPASEWRWPSFSPQEIACRGTGALMVDEAAMDKLQALRDLLGKPIILNSAFRSEAHNRKVGGAQSSMHLRARAFDCRMDNQDPTQFERLARQVGFTGFGFYVKQGFVHVDTGTAREWGTRFPRSKATPSFRPEQPQTVTAALAKPEVVGAVATAAVGSATTLAQGDGPVQIAIAFVLGLAALVVAGIVVAKVLRNRD